MTPEPLIAPNLAQLREVFNQGGASFFLPCAIGVPSTFLESTVDIIETPQYKNRVLDALKFIFSVNKISQASDFIHETEKNNTHIEGPIDSNTIKCLVLIEHIQKYSMEDRPKFINWVYLSLAMSLENPLPESMPLTPAEIVNIMKTFNFPFEGEDEVSFQTRMNIMQFTRYRLALRDAPDQKINESIDALGGWSQATNIAKALSTSPTLLHTVGIAGPVRCIYRLKAPETNANRFDTIGITIVAESLEETLSTLGLTRTPVSSDSLSRGGEGPIPITHMNETITVSGVTIRLDTASYRLIELPHCEVAKSSYRFVLCTGTMKKDNNEESREIPIEIHLMTDEPTTIIMNHEPLDGFRAKNDEITLSASVARFLNRLAWKPRLEDPTAPYTHLLFELLILAGGKGENDGIIEQQRLIYELRRMLPDQVFPQAKSTFNLMNQFDDPKVRAILDRLTAASIWALLSAPFPITGYEVTKEMRSFFREEPLYGSYTVDINDPFPMLNLLLKDMRPEIRLYVILCSTLVEGYLERNDASLGIITSRDRFVHALNNPPEQNQWTDTEKDFLYILCCLQYKRGRLNKNEFDEIHNLLCKEK